MQKDEKLHRRTVFLKKAAMRHGFLSSGIAKAGFLEEDAPRLESWLNKGYHGKMSYMERNFDLRLNPTKLVPGAKSVISLLFNYYPSERIAFKQKQFKISKYAYGQDYHEVIKKKLRALFQELQEEFGSIEGRVFVDSAPILEKSWAQKSGLGWIAKNANLISKQKGSFFFLAEIILDLEFEYDHPVTTDHCGSCTACIDACPTQAIIAPAVVDGSRCISYFTIELKEAIPESYKGMFDDWTFGCDTCQDVCPWNRFSKTHNEPLFDPNAELLELEKRDWIEMTEETFARVFKKSAVKRTKFTGLKRNIDFLKK
jgi:epoxyqueuosine reductase